MEMLFEEPEQVELKEETESKWISSYSGETGAGYSDNPLYGPFVREDAPYLESSIEAFFLKMEEVVHSVIFIYLGKERFSKDFLNTRQVQFFWDNSIIPSIPFNRL